MSQFAEPLIQSVHDLWFGPLDAAGCASPDKVKNWFSKDPAFDEHIRKHFLEYVDPAYMGALDRWIKTDEGLVALTVILDQFPRNIFRGQEQSFAYDKKALSIVYATMKDDRYLSMPAVYAYFCLMPTMHSEFLDVQNVGVEAFGKLLQAVTPPHKSMIANALSYAKAHRDIIARFGRFPHRNALVHRESTPEEMEFLKQPGSSF